jgi:ABC-type glycerol-3-phosphate transport system permease component
MPDFHTLRGEDDDQLRGPLALVLDVYRWGPLMAATLISSIPVAILYNLFLDRFIAGFTGGAVKG